MFILTANEHILTGSWLQNVEVTIIPVGMSVQWLTYWLYRSCGTFLYRERLQQQNGDMKKRDGVKITCTWLHVVQGRVYSPSLLPQERYHCNSQVFLDCITIIINNTTGSSTVNCSVLQIVLFSNWAVQALVMATISKRRRNEASILTSFSISKRNEPAFSRTCKDRSEANPAYSTP